MSQVHSDIVFPDPGRPESLADSIQALSRFSLEQDVRVVTTTYSMDPLDDLVLANAAGGAFTVTLPPIVNAQRKPYYVKRINAYTGANDVTVDGFGSETIDGSATFVLLARYESISVLHDGTQWWIV